MNFYAIWDGGIIHTNYTTFEGYKGLNAFISQGDTKAQMTIYQGKKKLMKMSGYKDKDLRGIFQDFEET